ncbi:hypothetical protein SDC9_101148 [bioreactor metagenome]|uniref:Uncharacterized protein n=1 Tax=bioreactor metagenome TaxID=1076179 RepID=A0A645AMM5_9ZZZZ
MKEWAEKYISREYVYSYSIDQAELIDILRTSCKKDGFLEQDGFRIKINRNRFRLRDAIPYRFFRRIRAFYGKVVPKETGCLIRGRFEPYPRSVSISSDIIFTVLGLSFGVFSQDLVSWIWVILVIAFIYSPTNAKQIRESEDSILEFLSSIAQKS